MLHVQKFIKEKGWDALFTELGITVKKYPEGIVKLNYDQINSPKSHPVVIECRGIILSYPEGEVVAKSFDRFFNHTEVLAITSQCDLNNADIFEKADGSIFQIYFCKATNKWEIATNGLAFAEGKHLQQGGTFRSSILAAMHVSEDDFQECGAYLDKNCTYVFEYTGPSNCIVTPYQQEQVVLLSVFDNNTCVELFDSIYDIYLRLISLDLNVRLPIKYACSTKEQVFQTLVQLNGKDEGFVARDRTTGVRVKIKSPSYLIYHRLKGSVEITPEMMVELILMNEDAEYLATIPEDSDKFKPYQLKIAEMKLALVEVWNNIQNIQDQKEFALEANKYFFKSLLYTARKSQVHPSTLVVANNLNINMILQSMK